MALTLARRRYARLGPKDESGLLRRDEIEGKRTIVRKASPIPPP